MLIFNAENAMLQPLLTARVILSHSFQLPEEFVTVEWRERDGRPTVVGFVAPPPDAAALHPDSAFFRMSKEQRNQIMNVTMSAARDDVAERMRELEAHRARKARG